MRYIMQTTTDNLYSKTADPEWRFLGEYPLNELMTEMDNRDRTNASLLFQTIRDMGIHEELLSNIESKLIRFAKEAIAHLNQGRLESPVYIRLFCQKKTVEDVNSAKSASQFNAELSIEPNQIIHQPDAGINGGWGCFLIKRGVTESEDASPRSQYFVDLYLYREG
jgi:hypothetical protein